MTTPTDRSPEVLLPAPTAQSGTQTGTLRARADLPAVMPDTPTPLRMRGTGSEAVSWRAIDGGEIQEVTLEDEPVTVFTASEPGTYRVVGSSASFSTGDTTTITVVSAAVTASITKLVIKPENASIQPNDTLRYSVWGLTAAGDSVPAAAKLYPSRGYDRGMDYYCPIEGTFTIAAGLPGTSIRVTTSVTVSASAPDDGGSGEPPTDGSGGTLARIEITPSRDTIPPNDTLTFRVRGISTTGSTMPVSVTLHPDRGYVSGLSYHSPIEGTFQIRALQVDGSLAASSYITVKVGAPPVSDDPPPPASSTGGTLASIEMTPMRDTIAPNDTLTFRVRGISTTGGTMPVSVTLHPDRGYVSGLSYHSPIEGTFQVRARQVDGSLTASSYITVKSGAPPVTDEPTDPTEPPDDNVTPVTPSGSVAELPRVFLDTRYVAPTGRTINVPAGGNLQAAINAAERGDQIVLAAGASFVGNFYLPPKAGSGWITIRSAGTLPTAGTRVTPSSASGFAELVSPNSMPAMRTLTSGDVRQYRLMGLEIRSSASMNYNIVNLGDYSGTATTVSALPQHIVLDRVYVHGTSSQNIRRCVALNGRSMALIDSWLSDCHYSNTDAQAVAGWDGPGPFKIVNNHLSGASENIMFGGADPRITGVTPADIEIRRNHIYKPLSWKGAGWSVKNLIEIKHGKRILVEANVLENNWAESQTGFAVVLKSSNQQGGCSWCVARDLTFRSNRIINSPSGFNVASSEDYRNGGVVPASHIAIVNNLFERVGLLTQPGDRRVLQLLGSLTFVQFEHNTTLTQSHIIMFDGGPATNTGHIIRNNLATRGRYGIFGSGHGEGSGALSYYAPGAVVARNVIIGAPASMYPSGNYYPASLSAAGVVTGGAGEAWLGAGSPYLTSATDGTMIGADYGAVTDATAGVR